MQGIGYKGDRRAGSQTGGSMATGDEQWQREPKAVVGFSEPRAKVTGQ